MSFLYKIALTSILTLVVPGFAFSNTCADLFSAGGISTLDTAKQMIAAGQTESGTERNRVFVQEPHFVRIRVGMPPTLRLVPSEGRIFRHYTSKTRLQDILKTQMLQAGWTPFYYSGYMVDYNEDLTGIFITTPEEEPHTIGVRSENAHFVDFKFPTSTGILFLRDGILLVPGTPAVEPWKLNLYHSERRQMYLEYANEFANWDQNGIPQPLTVPIEIVGYSSE